MPSNCLTFPIRISGEIYLAGFFSLTLQPIHHLFLIFWHCIVRLKIFLYLNSQLTLRQIPHMSIAGRYRKRATQKTPQSPRFGRGFDYYEWMFSFFWHSNLQGRLAFLKLP